jgi:putative long chain acyl-CoA synthase
VNTVNTPVVPSAVQRLVSTAVNGFEVLRYGGLRVEEAPAPYDVVAHEPVYRLRRYYPQDGPGRLPVLLIPPLMQVAEVWDISPSSSAVSMLHEQGLDPWVVDFGDPATEPGGADRSFSDHALAVVDAIGRVRAATGMDVHVGGYSQGGVFCYVAAAYLGCEGVASVFVLGSPLGTVSLENYLPDSLVWDAARLPGKVLGKTGLPRWAVAQMFNWSNPQRTIKNDIDFILALNDRESLLPREPQRKFLKRGAWIGWSGPAIAELIDFLRENRFVDGGVVIGDRTVGLSDITCPVLIFIGEADQFGPAHLVRRIVDAAPKAEVYECLLPVGHFGLPVSSYAREKTWPGTAAFVRWCAGEGQLPDYFRRLCAEDVAQSSETRARSVAATVTYGAGLAAQALFSALPSNAAQTAQRAAAVARELSLEAMAQAPRLLRLERMGPRTRVSYGFLLESAARTRPDEVAFLFADRAHTYAACQRRTDNVVRGLLSVGVRRGEHVGVLMDMRPSALVTVAALNRIGAVSVLLRPGPDVGQETRLGQVTKVIADPEHAATAMELGLEVLVLGGGAGRPVPAGAVDLEQVDPHAVQLPTWYTPDPGLARDVAFILFTGRGADIRADKITNGRWATSAYVAATAAALTPRDTVYSMSPLWHASGLLLTTAAPIASGARLAMATRFDPDSFWAEVRRYGVTVVPYTWTMLHSLVTADPQLEEHNHPIRLFVGSGMPPGLWRRVEERFGPAVVLELYASTRSDAILGNVSDRKVGAFGKALPGTPRTRVVACDDDGRVQTGPDGYAIPTEVDEIGLLLVEVRPESGVVNDVPLRGVFEPEDAWVSTGDLFRVDRDGDLWFVDSLAAQIRTGSGLVSPRRVENALGALDSVDLVACYQVGDASAVVALTARTGRTITDRDLTEALAGLDLAQRPDVVRLVDAMPMTSWWRPSVANLTAEESPDVTIDTWRLDRRTGRYGR